MVHRLAEHVQHASQRLFSYGDGYRRACIVGLHAADEPIGGLHRDGSHDALTNMLSDLGRDVDLDRDIKSLTGDSHCVEDCRYMPIRELDLNGRSRHFYSVSFYYAVRT